MVNSFIFGLLNADSRESAEPITACNGFASSLCSDSRLFDGLNELLLWDVFDFFWFKTLGTSGLVCLNQRGPRWQQIPTTDMAERNGRERAEIVRTAEWSNFFFLHRGHAICIFIAHVFTWVADLWSKGSKFSSFTFPLWPVVASLSLYRQKEQTETLATCNLHLSRRRGDQGQIHFSCPPGTAAMSLLKEHQAWTSISLMLGSIDVAGESIKKKSSMPFPWVRLLGRPQDVERRYLCWVRISCDWLVKVRRYPNKWIKKKLFMKPSLSWWGNETLKEKWKLFVVSCFFFLSL